MAGESEESIWKRKRIGWDVGCESKGRKPLYAEDESVGGRRPRRVEQRLESVTVTKREPQRVTHVKYEHTTRDTPHFPVVTPPRGRLLLVPCTSFRPLATLTTARVQPSWPALRPRATRLEHPSAPPDVCGSHPSIISAARPSTLSADPSAFSISPPFPSASG